jgi:hypothetical protein
MGEMSSNGHRIYGYHYVKKTSTAPATLVINEEQAEVVLRCRPTDRYAMRACPIL